MVDFDRYIPEIWGRRVAEAMKIQIDREIMALLDKKYPKPDPEPEPVEEEPMITTAIIQEEDFIGKHFETVELVEDRNVIPRREYWDLVESRIDKSPTKFSATYSGTYVGRRSGDRVNFEQPFGAEVLSARDQFNEIRTTMVEAVLIFLREKYGYEARCIWR